MRVVLRAAGLGLALMVAAFALLVWQIDSLGRYDDARPADAIVVLGARVNPDGSPGSDLTSRSYHAVDLWQAGIAPNIICTGGYKGERLSAAAVCKRFVAGLGVTEELIWVADGSTNTDEDALRTAEIVSRNGWRSVVLVSHPLHLYRARWLFDRAGVNAATSPTSTETGAIFWPLRLWYAAREAGAIILTALNGYGLVSTDLIANLQNWSAELP
jgi:uncharacterized SAM-binding protein YcdF (DUF218 family)